MQVHGALKPLSDKLVDNTVFHLQRLGEMDISAILLKKYPTIYLVKADRLAYTN